MLGTALQEDYIIALAVNNEKALKATKFEFFFQHRGHQKMYYTTCVYLVVYSQHSYIVCVH